MDIFVEKENGILMRAVSILNHFTIEDWENRLKAHKEVFGKIAKEGAILDEVDPSINIYKNAVEKILRGDKLNSEEVLSLAFTELDVINKRLVLQRHGSENVGDSMREVIGAILESKGIDIESVQVIEGSMDDFFKAKSEEEFLENVPMPSDPKKLN